MGIVNFSLHFDAGLLELFSESLSATFILPLDLAFPFWKLYKSGPVNSLQTNWSTQTNVFIKTPCLDVAFIYLSIFNETIAIHQAYVIFIYLVLIPQHSSVTNRWSFQQTSPPVVSSVWEGLARPPPLPLPSLVPSGARLHLALSRDSPGPLHVFAEF